MRRKVCHICAVLSLLFALFALIAVPFVLGYWARATDEEAPAVPSESEVHAPPVQADM